MCKFRVVYVVRLFTQSPIRPLHRTSSHDFPRRRSIHQTDSNTKNPLNFVRSTRASLSCRAATFYSIFARTNVVCRIKIIIRPCPLRVRANYLWGYLHRPGRLCAKRFSSKISVAFAARRFTTTNEKGCERQPAHSGIITYLPHKQCTHTLCTTVNILQRIQTTTPCTT